MFASSLARDLKSLRLVNRGCCICRHSRRTVSTLPVCGIGSFQDFSNCWIQRAVCGVACRPEVLHLERRQLWAVELTVGCSPFSVELRKEEERTIREWFRMHESDSCRNGVFKLLTKEHITLCGGWGWQIMDLRLNNWATFDTLMTAHWFIMTLWNLLIKHSSCKRCLTP